MTAPDDLEITTPTDLEIVTTRSFDAPPDLVFAAFTEPALLRRWFGPTGWTLVVCEVDLREGGAWRFVVRRPEGREIGMGGHYREIVPGQRLVYVEAWEDWDPGEIVVTNVFTVHGGRTRLTRRARFPSLEVRDFLLQGGFRGGSQEMFGKLDGLLAEVNRTAPSAS
jgi:uncharacterized protein YndB with AHSA1/START domain